MTKMTTTYLGNLRTEALHIQSGSTIITDAPLDNLGKGEYFSPTDLLSASLASCMLTIMGITANNKGINIDGAKVEITKIMISDPRRVGEIVVEFIFPKNNYTEEEKRILENAAKHCPVAKSLHPELVQTKIFHY